MNTYNNKVIINNKQVIYNKSNIKEYTIAIYKRNKFKI